MIENKPKIALIDDEELYHDLWTDALDGDVDLFCYNCYEKFYKINKGNMNKFDYIILDMLFKNDYGHTDILKIEFSKKIRNRYSVPHQHSEFTFTSII